MNDMFTIDESDKPWRVISEYIYFNQHTHMLTIPILTDVSYALKVGERICHIDLIGSILALGNIKGNIFSYDKIYFFINFQNNVTFVKGKMISSFRMKKKKKKL
jgi:hypothetical protein